MSYTAKHSQQIRRARERIEGGGKCPDWRKSMARGAASANAKLDDGRMVKFLDINPKFLGADGTLPKSLMPDLLHPNEQGYQIWADAMGPTLDEMLK